MPNISPPQPPLNLGSLNSAGAKSIQSASNTGASNSALPWQNSPLSTFFPYIKIDPQRWDQLFPYRLVVIDSSKGNKIVNGTPQLQVTGTSSAGSTIVDFQPIGRQWVFTLPISPQQFSMVDQYAIQTTATLKGVLEEHGGIKFKIINASGTMGVWPYRQSVTQPPTTPNILQSLFGGTISAAQNVATQFNRALSAAQGKHPAPKPVTVRPEKDPSGGQSTGYYQALALQQFLEQYAEAKKNPANAGWRLVFDIPKQNQSFVVTPMQYVWNQSANRPMEIMYNLQLKAWRRVDLQQKVSAIKPTIQTISPGILQRILGTITEARQTLSAVTDLIGAVRSDVTTPLNVLRQTSLFVKDLAGIVGSVADLPSQIVSDYSSSVKESMNILSESISSVVSDTAAINSLNLATNSIKTSEGLSQSAVSGGQLGSQAATAQSIDPANNMFSSPEENFELMDQVPLDSLVLSDAQQAVVDEVIEEARNTSVDDLKQFRSTILELALQFSNNFGAGDTFFSQVYSRPAPRERIQPMTLDEYDILKKLYDMVQAYDILTATTDIDDAQRQTNMEYVAGLADDSDIPFTVPNSKILAPVPFGLTIEEIAQRYLGDAQRWIEIATLNNLRDPYIDEDGFKVFLTSNASGRQIVIDSIENLYIGQRILLGSSTQPQTARRILDIDELSETSFLLTLDGEANLDNYLLADDAYIQAYLPGTTNSQQKIFIPSDLPLPTEPSIIVPSSTAADPLTGLSKVDLLLTDSGDLAINNYGDFRYAYGITNIVQALKIKIGTPKGKLLFHPEFGLGIQPGVISSELTVQDLFNSISKLLEDDARFSGLESLQISLIGPTLSIGMGVALAGQTGVFPLTFELKT